MTKRFVTNVIILGLTSIAHASDTPEIDCNSDSIYSLVSSFIFNVVQGENCEITGQRSAIANVDLKYASSLTPDSVYRATISKLTNIRLRTDFVSDNMQRLESKNSPKMATQAKPPEGFFILSEEILQ